jgi:uncharacterized protein YdiU (UPF0061 family)
MNRHVADFEFDNSFARDMEGFYVPWQGEVAPNPELLLFNEDLAAELGFEASTLTGELGAKVFSGGLVPDGATPIAQAYAGHQFGGFSEQLGDGRALLLGEVIDLEGQRRDIQLKGSGRTPFSRGGDGKAVLGPVLREYLMGEAMQALGVPTTRALAAVATGERIMRDRPEPGAVLTRVAASHLRVGTFQFFAARGEHDKVRKLADYAIARHYPHLKDAENKYLALLSAVIEAQVALVARWNLARFAETLLPMIDPDNDENAIRLATNEVNSVPARYTTVWLEGIRQKIGLMSEEAEDAALVNDMFLAMENQSVDYTLFFRRLAEAADGISMPISALFDDAEEIAGWLTKWRDRCLRDPQSPLERRTAMEQVSPIYIPRNHKVEEALAEAKKGDLAPFKRLLKVLAAPYGQRSGLEEFEFSAPGDFGSYTTFCGT